MSQSPRPTAIIYSNDEMAVAGMCALREMGLEGPRDVSVVGYSDLTIGKYAWPSLTTVRQSREEFGRAAVGLLMDQIQRGSLKKGSRLVLSPRLVVRQSTGPC